jgi:bacillithiol biosynthesis cysteine-adding enzyme BshC
MIVESVSLPLANRLAHDYQQRKADALQFFQYDPYDPDAYRERLDWLRRCTYPHRERLAEGLHTYNEQVGNHPHALRNIDKLRDPDTYVVIAGQQAGVMTGPLYTIHKAIHLIRAARKLQAELQVEVVPVFWIAGEDHDIDEIDHLYLLTDAETKVTRHRLELPKKGRVSASRLPLDHAACDRFLAEVFRGQTETNETAAIRDLLLETAKESATVVDWFARLMARLFGHHGLVLVESSLPFVRELERPVFARLIEQNERISELLLDARRQILQTGYEPQLAVEPHQANLFLYEGDDRLLVERHGERFSTRRSSYTRDELLSLLERDPARFSANVVSRPLMQEHLFPTLAFIGGPGEVAYWAFFRQVFAELGYRLPIVLPRLSITLLEGAVERLLGQLGLTVETVLTGFADWKEEWLKRNEPDPLSRRFAETRQAILDLYRPLVEEVIQVDAGLRELAEKNVCRLLEQVDFLQERLRRSLIQREEVSYRRLMRVEAALLPEGVWQERKLSFFTFANKYGLSLLDRLVEAPFALDGTHQIIHL